MKTIYGTGGFISLYYGGHSYLDNSATSGNNQELDWLTSSDQIDFWWGAGAGAEWQGPGWYVQSNVNIHGVAFLTASPEVQVADAWLASGSLDFYSGVTAQTSSLVTPKPANFADGGWTVNTSGGFVQPFSLPGSSLVSEALLESIQFVLRYIRVTDLPFDAIVVSRLARHYVELGFVSPAALADALRDAPILAILTGILHIDAQA